MGCIPGIIKADAGLNQYLPDRISNEIAGLPWYCPPSGSPPLSRMGLAFCVVTTSKQALNVGVGEGYTVVGKDEEEVHPVVPLYIPVTFTVAGPAASQLMVAELLPCPATTLPGVADQVYVQAMSRGVW